jgi:hypothetical protein
VLEAIFTELGPAEQTLVYRLAHCPVSCSLEAARVLAGQSSDDETAAQALLDKLQASRVVALVATDGGARIQLAPPLRRAIVEGGGIFSLVTEQDRAAHLGAFVACYLRLLQRVSAMYQSSDDLTALWIFDTERENLQVLIRVLVEQQEGFLPRAAATLEGSSLLLTFLEAFTSASCFKVRANTRIHISG